MRPRSAVARQITHRTTVGVVARSSMGFGLAVGMSQGSRPVVTPDTFTSTRLRPPVSIWRRHDDDADSVVPAPSWSEQITRATRPARSNPSTTARRSATDDAPVATVADDGFVPSGDRRRDALRQMLSASSPGRPAAQPASTRGATTGRSAADSAAGEAQGGASAAPAAAPTSIGRRGDTLSGPSTAPGQIGRRFRPEPASLEADKAALPSAPDTPDRRSSRAARTQPRGTRDLDAFRRMLEAGGKIPASRPDDSADELGRSSGSRPAQGGPPSSTPQRPGSAAPTVSPDRRSGDSPAGPAGTTPETARRSASTPPSDPTGSDTASARGSTTVPERPAVQVVGRDMLGTHTLRSFDTDHHEPGSTATALQTAAQPDSRQRFGTTPVEAVDPAIDAVAPPRDATTTTTGTVDTLERAPTFTRTEQTRSTPGAALAALAGRAGLPHTQSDQRRPSSTIARSIMGDATTQAVTRRRRADSPTPVTSPPIAVSAPGSTTSARTPSDTATISSARAPASSRSPVDDARPVPPAAKPSAETPEPAGATAARNVERSTQRSGIPAAVSSVADPPRPTAAAEHASIQRAPFPFAGEQADRVAQPARQLARPGHLGRTAGEQPAINQLQRRSIVRPGPGALQRALTETGGAHTDATGSPLTRPGSVAPVVAAAGPAPRTTAAPGSDPSRPASLHLEPGQAAVRPQHAEDPPTSTHTGHAPTRPPASRPAEAWRPDSEQNLAGRAEQSTPSVPSTPDAARRAAEQRTMARHDPGSDRVRRSADAVIEPVSSAAVPVDSVAPPAASLGDRFLHELSRRPAPQPKPLPEAYQPIAQAITGHHRVLLSVDDNSRRALRSVNKVAATTDNVIHLDRPLTPGPKAAEVLAHELTHVAHPSPAPRFFDDDVRSPEERQAEQVARVMARAPIAPSGAVSRSRSAPPTPSVRSTGTSDSVRRTPASTAGSRAGTLNAQALAASITGGAAASSAAASVVQRSTSSSPSAINRNGDEQTIRRLAESPDTETISDAGTGSREPSLTDHEFRQLLERNFEYVLRKLEQRMIVELERRGGRFWRGV